MEEYKKFALIEFLIYSIVSSYALLSQYFAEVGFSSSQIGILMSLMPINSLITNPLYFRIAEKKGKVFILRVLILPTIFFLWLVFLSKGFLHKLIFMTFLTFFLPGIIPMAESLAIEKIPSYGKVRLWGTVGFLVSAFSLGILVRFSFVFIFLWMTSLLALIFVIFRNVRDTSVSTERRERTKVPVFFLLILLFVILGISSNYFNFVFLPVLFKIRNYDVSLAGITISLMTTTEILFLMFSERVLRFMGTKLLFNSGLLVIGLRLLLVPLLKNPLSAMLIQFLHGWTYIVIYYAVMQMIQSELPLKSRTIARTLFWMTLQGFAPITGSSLGGFLSEAIGISQTYYLLGTAALISAFAFFFLQRKF